jgi:HlyD family secretion protein
MRGWFAKRGIIAAIFGLLLVAAVGAWLYVDFSDDVVPGVLEASGRVEGDQAAVGAKIGGRVLRLDVREGQTLRARDLIAEFSSEQAKAQLEQAEHDLHTAREEMGRVQARMEVLNHDVEAAETAVRLAGQESQARIGGADAALKVARAEILKAEAEQARAEKDYNRYKALFAQEAVTPREIDQAEAAFRAAKAAEEASRNRITQAEENLGLARTTVLAVELREKELAQARARLKEARASVEVARARVQSADAARMLAQANVKETRVVAPFTGTVLWKLVQEGEVVAAGTPLITFVDMSRLHVKVYVPERDIAKIKLGNPARIYVDAFRGRFFEATVSEVSQQAEFTPRDIHMKDERVKLVFAVKLAPRIPRVSSSPGYPPTRESDGSPRLHGEMG